MKVLARNMAFILKCKETALKNGVELPKRHGNQFLRRSRNKV